MPRFFLDTIPDDEAVILGEDARHIAKSLRMRPGEEVTLCDCLGYDYRGEIAEVSPEAVRVRILEICKSFAEPSVQVTLCQALLKGDKMDWVVQKAVELGVRRIQPMVTARCVSRPDEKALSKKVQRWQKIALEAAKQSGRGIIPEVLPAVSFQKAVKAAPKPRLLFYEGGGRRVPELLSETEAALSMFIGPEGGFADEEVAQMEAEGGVRATLGPRILRAETAPLAALAAVMVVTGNL